MPEITKDEKEIIEQKLEYIGLDLENVPEFLKIFKPLNYRPLESYDDTYKIYKYINICDIQILITPTDRLTSLQEKYKLANPILEYLDSENEEDIEKFAKFLEMVKNLKIDDIEEIETEQELLKDKIPFEVKYKNNFIWQIYYSDYCNKYFMLVPTREANNPELFYILKQQIQCNKEKGQRKIFVPISNMEYSERYLKKTEINDIENYLWYFTKQWPNIYEVYDNDENLEVQILGQVDVYEKVLSTYKIKIRNKEEATEFLKLLKALFILSTGAEEQYKIDLKINEQAGLYFLYNNEKIEYSYLPIFINTEVNKKIKEIEKVKNEITTKKERLQRLKKVNDGATVEYLERQKQISTFLECKKSFLGKIKYYFKNKSKKKQIINDVKTKVERENIEPETIYEKKEQYTLEDLIGLCTRLNSKNEINKNMKLDINAMELKITNLTKKIENAELYINEIEKHKKSIFEFWKFTNKDEISTLTQGEQEELPKTKIEKCFDYIEDMEELGKKADELQRRKLSKNETDAIYAVKQAINSVKAFENEYEDIKEFKKLKQEYEDNMEYINMKDFNIFGSMNKDKTQISTINNQKHREIPKDKYKVLNINANTEIDMFKENLKNNTKLVEEAFSKITLQNNIAVYKLLQANMNGLEIFNISPIKELENIKEDSTTLHKFNLQEGVPILFYSNIIFYENFNKTLPIGMDLSTEVLLDLNQLEMEKINENEFNYNVKRNEFDYEIRKIKVIEYNVKKKRI